MDKINLFEQKISTSKQNVEVIYGKGDLKEIMTELLEQMFTEKIESIKNR